MSKFKEKREQQRILDKVWEEGIDAATKFCNDQEYVFYLTVCTFGGMLLKQLGREKFLEIVDEILEKNES